MGEKTEGERFAGAINTYTIEAIMQDGQMLQCGTSHYLGQNFSKPYDVKFQTNNNDFDYVYQTSAGISTRLIGAIIMSHADDNGLVLPFHIAPTQIAILTIKSDTNENIKLLANQLYDELSKKYRVVINDSNDSFGYKLAEQEVVGTPFCIMIGPKDIENHSVILTRRDNQSKSEIYIKDLDNVLKSSIDLYDKSLYQNANQRLQNSIVEVSNIDQLKQVIAEHKIALAP